MNQNPHSCECCGVRQSLGADVRFVRAVGIELCQLCWEDCRFDAAELWRRVEIRRATIRAQAIWHRPSSFHSKSALRADFPLGNKKTLCREYQQVRSCRTFLRKTSKSARVVGFAGGAA